MSNFHNFVRSLHSRCQAMDGGDNPSDKTTPDTRFEELHPRSGKGHGGGRFRISDKTLSRQDSEDIHDNEGNGNERRSGKDDESDPSGESTGDIRGLLEESRGVPEETRREYAAGSRHLDMEQYGRMAAILGRWLQSRISSGGDCERIRVKNPRTGGHEGILKIDGKSFRTAFEACKPYIQNGDQVDLHDEEFYNDGGFGLVREDGTAGFYITKDGDAVSGYSLAGFAVVGGIERRVAGGGFFKTIAPLMRKYAKTTDCFATDKQNLPKFYEEVFGFKRASELAFNYDILASDRGRDYADWFVRTYGESPVTFMVMTDDPVEAKSFPKDDWDGAHGYQQQVANSTSRPKTGIALDKRPSTFYGWQHEKRPAWSSSSAMAMDARTRGAATAMAPLLPSGDFETPLWKCTARGGPAKCKYHSRFLRSHSAQEALQVSAQTTRKMLEREDSQNISSMGSDKAADLLNDIIENGGGEMFTQDTLNAIDAITRGIRSGDVVPCRIPSDLARPDCTVGIPDWGVSIQQLLGAVMPDYDAMVENPDNETLGNIEFETRAVKEFASRKGVFIDNAFNRINASADRYLGAGQESVCWKFGDTAVKIMSVPAFRMSPLRAIESIMMHNFYFPDTAMELLGICDSEDGSGIGLVLGQKMLDLRSPRTGNVFLLKTIEFMSKRGFEFTGETSFPSKDETVVVNDIHEDNIRIAKDGRLVVIDSYPEFVSPQAGGRYDIKNPPKTLFSTPFTKQEHVQMKQQMESDWRESLERAVRSGVRSRKTTDSAMPDIGFEVRHPTTIPVSNPFYDPERFEAITGTPCSMTDEELIEDWNAHNSIPNTVIRFGEPVKVPQDPERRRLRKIMTSRMNLGK